MNMPIETIKGMNCNAGLMSKSDAFMIYTKTTAMRKPNA